MAIIDIIKNKVGEIIYPKTVTKAIYDADTEDRLDNTIGTATLTTIDKTLKGAINEVDGYSKGLISDSTTSLTKVWSSSKVSEIKEDVDNNSFQLSNYARNILLDGGNYDGVTPNDTAFNLSRNFNRKSDYRGWVYFPNNEIGNAVYYFTSTPFYDTTYISADKGVKLSFPSTNGKTFQKVFFKDDITIISRDRNNSGLQYANDYSNLPFQTLT